MKATSEQRRNWKHEKQDYRSRTTTFSLTYKTNEAREFKRLAMTVNQSTPSYIKSIVKSHLTGNRYVIPPNIEEQIRTLEMLLRKSANNVNQLVRKVHANQHLSIVHIETLQTILVDTKEAVVLHLTQPDSIESIIEAYVQKHPEKRDQLLQFIKDLNITQNDI